jgi:hypothetical protein
MSNEADLFELLEAEHVRLVRMIHEGSPDLVAEVSAHLVAESQLLYPAARRSLPDDEVLDESLDRDHRIEEALTRLDGSEERREDLLALFETHADALDNDLFPRLRDVIDEEDLIELGGALPIVLAQAPTRPHPHMPDEGPLEVIGDTLAAGVDRLRDRFDGPGGNGNGTSSTD